MTAFPYCEALDELELEYRAMTGETNPPKPTGGEAEGLWRRA